MNERTFEDHLEQLAEEGRRLRDVAAVDLQTPVPSCPGWTQADLLRHQGKVYRWATLNVETLSDERQRLGDSVDMPDDDAVLGWFDEALDGLLDALEDADPEAELWTYGSDDTVEFWARRMAHETLIHRWDAQNAGGSGEGFDPTVAADAIDEFLDVHIMTPGKLGEADHVLHVRAHDANADWSLDPEYDDELGRGFAEGDAHLQGPASEMLLSLWKRRDPDAVRWEGDRDAITEWSTILAELEL